MKKLFVLLVLLLIIAVTNSYAIQILNNDGSEPIATLNASAIPLVSPAENTGFRHTFVLWFSGLANNWSELDISHFTGYKPSAAPISESSIMILLGTGLVGIAGIGRKK